MTDKLAKLDDTQLLDNCPKCQSENSMLSVTALKWGKVAKWQHFKECQACGYETKAK